MLLRYPGASQLRLDRLRVLCQAETKCELRICINRTCNCGNGPNMVLLPSEQILHHVATPSDLMQVLGAFCGSDIDDTVLQATQLRLSGNSHAARQEFRKAIECYSQALQLDPPVGAHMLYSNRSATYLQAGEKESALADAQRAVELAPPGFHNAPIRLIDALYALGRFGEAAEACRRAEQRDSSFRFREEYKAIRKALQEVGQAV
ncbi:hypothetical protein PLESTB_001704500 [Pleodorina starrii]|uniref:Uncharacterized protein n=1 Tax=Pleodorina starrii TaxID=330485 RepID=A0A9W6BYP5_9CHLO|nr:hypothetical protein PLESTB_001704500 [Pleodorina starrii]